MAAWCQTFPIKHNEDDLKSPVDNEKKFLTLHCKRKSTLNKFLFKFQF